MKTFLRIFLQVLNDHDSAVFNDHDLLHDQDETQQPEETFLHKNYTFLETITTAPTA